LPARRSNSSQGLPADEPFANILPDGDKYVFGQKMLRAITLANVGTRFTPSAADIRHFAPGNGGTALHVGQRLHRARAGRINQSLAVQCLNLTPHRPGSQSAFIHHGSPVPVQMYAFWTSGTEQSPGIGSYCSTAVKKVLQASGDCVWFQSPETHTSARQRRAMVDERGLTAGRVV